MLRLRSHRVMLRTVDCQVGAYLRRGLWGSSGVIQMRPTGISAMAGVPGPRPGHLIRLVFSSQLSSPCQPRLYLPPGTG